MKDMININQKILRAHRMKDAEELDSLSKRLKYLMDTAGIKQVHLASKLGISPQAVNQLCNSNTQSSKHTKKLAEILKVSEQWLEKGTGAPFTESTESAPVSKSGFELPVYFFEQLKKIHQLEDISNLKSVETYWTKSTLNKKSFAFYMPDQSLAPKFEKCDIIVIEPTSNIHNGVYALVYLSAAKDLTFCKIYSHAESGLVMGFIPSLDSGLFTIADHDIIIGVYRECLKKSE